MGPNDAELVRVFSRMPAAAIGDTTIPVLQNFEIVVEAEHGVGVINQGYNCGVVVRDLTANNVIATNPPNPLPGATGDPNWPVQPNQFVFVVPAANTAGLNDHICEIVAYLKVGGDVSFATSPRFILE